MENIFDALCSCLSSPTPAPPSAHDPAVHAVKQAFLEGEGVELLVLMLKAKNLSRPRAIKTLDHALQGREGAPLCERFVESLGLKTLFAVFMGRVSPARAPYKDRPYLHTDDRSLLTHANGSTGRGQEEEESGRSRRHDARRH